MCYGLVQKFPHFFPQTSALFEHAKTASGVLPEAIGYDQIYSSTRSFFWMLGMPPECSVDRLAAAAAKRPI